MAEKPVLWITRKLSDYTQARAARDYQLVLNPEDTLHTAETIIEMSHKVDGILPCHSEMFSADVVARLGNRTKIVANYSVGIDHCDLPAFQARGIRVTNTPDVLSDATAEVAMLLMLGAARRAVEGDRMVRDQKWTSWSPSFMVGQQVSGKRLGIIGMGRVGQIVAKRAQGFDMTVHYFNRHRLEPALEKNAIFHKDLHSMLAVSDFLSLNCPATEDTRGIMGPEAFSYLPDGAIMVNTARGALVDEEAFLAAITSGKLSAAGLDCFATEPGGNPKFARHDNIFMLPHIGSATQETRDAMGDRALDNLDAFFAGRTPVDLVA